MEGSEVLDVNGKTPLVALLIGNMRFGRHHQESNIAGVRLNMLEILMTVAKYVADHIPGHPPHRAVRGEGMSSRSVPRRSEVQPLPQYPARPQHDVLFAPDPHSLHITSAPSTQTSRPLS